MCDKGADRLKGRAERVRAAHEVRGADPVGSTDTTGRLRRVVAAIVPAVGVLAVQMAFFPLPFGVTLQGVIIGLLGSLVAVGMALVYRANRILNFAQVQLGLAPTALAVSLIVYGGVNYFLAVSIGLVGSILVGGIVELVIIRSSSIRPA
jgi:branched-chain amino acid transport system permease protein